MPRFICNETYSVRADSSSDPLILGRSCTDSFSVRLTLAPPFVPKLTPTHTSLMPGHSFRK
eukprot:6963032-Pyramimonas_sp.AAC.1